MSHPPTSSSHGAVVVGIGVTGIYQQKKLLDLGLDVKIIETGVGGTWYWNRYPAARFDSESYVYGYFSDKKLTGRSSTRVSQRLSAFSPSTRPACPSIAAAFSRKLTPVSPVSSSLDSKPPAFGHGCVRRRQTLKEKMNGLIGTTYGEPPYYYDKGEEVTVVFRTDRDILAPLLPPVLELPEGPGIGVLRAVHHVRSSFGPYIGVYLAARALLNGELVQHCLTGMKTNFAGAVAAREVWGMPLQVGDATMEWKDDLLMLSAGRRGVEFVRMSLKLQTRSEPPKVKPTLTYASPRPTMDDGDTGSVLRNARGAVEDPSAVRHWTASSTLKLLAGDPGDDWSILPVREILETHVSTGGHSSLHRGEVLAEW